MFILVLELIYLPHLTRGLISIVTMPTFLYW